jgi:hypothetical protein
VNLERELQLLGPSIDWPDAPDVSSAVMARIAEASPRRAPRRRLALALAVLLAALLAVLAVPPARTAILDWLGVGGARIVQVDELPTAPTTPGIEFLGDRITLEQARERAGFPFAGPPDDAGAPDEVRVAPGTRVTYVWLDGERARLLITQFPGSATDPGLVKKHVGQQTDVERLEVDRYPAIWLAGGPHVVYFLAPTGDVREDVGWLAGNTLLVDREGTTVRIEGRLTRAQAVELFRAMD